MAAQRENAERTSAGSPRGAWGPPPGAGTCANVAGPGLVTGNGTAWAARIHCGPPLEVLMHYDAHQPVIDGLEARIVTIRDSL